MSRYIVSMESTPDSMISEHAANRFSLKNDPCDILGQVWYLVVSIPDLCHLSYFYSPVDFCISAFNTKRLVACWFNG